MTRFFMERLGPDVELSQITPDDIRAFRAHIEENNNRFALVTELRLVTKSWMELGLTHRSLWEAAGARVGKKQINHVVGLAPALFDEVVAAATRDVEMIIDRIRRGEALLRRFREGPDLLNDEERLIGGALNELAMTGKVPSRLGRLPDGTRRYDTIAPQLFIMRADVDPILVLLAARSGRNPETLKELSARHAIREGKLLETTVVKRRQGFESEPVSWEIGGPTRRLKLSGSLYLVVHELTQRARELAGSDALFCVFSQTHGGGAKFLWEDNLGNMGVPTLGRWVGKHGLQEDGGPLRLTLSRIKTTVDRDRAKNSDFDLDRAAVSNTPTVLYESYVAPDPTARRALQSITNGALLELDAQLTNTESPEKVAPISSRPPVSGEPDAIATAFMQCRDVLGRPAQEGVECTATMLDCFGCPCAVVGDENIPTIMRLSEELIQRFDRYPLGEWVHRYGQAWLAINNDILPSRSPQELALFASKMPDATALSLLDDPEMF